MIVIPEDGFDDSPVDGLSANANASSGEGEDAPASSEKTPGNPLNTKSDPATPPPAMGDSWSFDRPRPGRLPVSASAPTAADTPTPGAGQDAGAAAWQRLQTAQQGVDDSPYAGASSGSPAQTVGDSWQFPGWANNQRFGMQETYPGAGQGDDLNQLRFGEMQKVFPREPGRAGPATAGGQTGGSGDASGLDDFSRSIYRGTLPTTYGDGRRPWADDFMANYEKELPAGLPPNDEQYPPPEEIYRRAGGDIAQQPDQTESCGLRLSRALDLSDAVNGRFAIPLAPHDRLYLDGVKVQSYDIAYSELPDRQSHATLGYITRAEEMNTYLQHAWGKPDISLSWGPKDDVDSMKAKVNAIQANLRPGEAAVFARPNHTGVMTSYYKDPSAPYPGKGVMNIWVLQPKPE